jgi:response regulator RpfG family c-di-GMP phosphodiesterase
MSKLKQIKEIAQELIVLYVEDDNVILNDMSKYLDKIFYKVINASDGLEGLKKYKENQIDLVITDLSMPKMDGIEMLKEIYLLNENQSTLITTAHNESKYMFEAIKLGIDGYIIKPFDYGQLNKQIFKIVEKLKKFKENEEYKKNLQLIIDKKTIQLHENYEKTLYSLVDMIEKRDTYTAGHSKRVAHYCKLIAQEMGYSKDECNMIYQAGVLHDIGKIGIPDSILLNPKKLDELEYKIIQEHVSISFNLLNNIPMFKPLAKIIYAHHERYDGNGYPNKLSKEEVPPLSRIMILADAFDAMTTNRIYKSRKTIDETFQELQAMSKKQFHPEVVASAIKALRNIKLDDDINQLPKTKLEEERFAYFYKDNITEAHNQNYLDVVLMKNRDVLEFRYLLIISINNFSIYNKKYGWHNGDKLLNLLSEILLQKIKDKFVFRVFGDKFVILSKKEIDISILKDDIDKLLLTQYPLNYKVHKIDLEHTKIKSTQDIYRLDY